MFSVSHSLIYEFQVQSFDSSSLRLGCYTKKKQN